VRHHLIVYAKRPLPGYAKTRLGTDIGDEQAAGVYARLLYAYLLDLLCADLAEMSVDTVELSVAAASVEKLFSDAFPEFLVHPQVAGDLGQRMEASFEQAFAAGAEAVVLTGSDIPGLNSQIVRAAFDALDASPVVIGPASDGGYYLIGMRAPGAPLFEGVEWSSERVLAQTEALAGAHGLVVARLSEQHDVDTVEDLVRWQQETLRSDRGGQQWLEPAKEQEGRGEVRHSTRHR